MKPEIFVGGISLIEAILKIARKVTYAHFVLKPSNPDMSEDSRKIDEALRAMGAETAKLDVSSNRGLNYDHSNLLTSSLAQVHRGYGRYTLIYENESGERIKFQSWTKNFKESFEKPKDKEGMKNKLKQVLGHALKMLEEK